MLVSIPKLSRMEQSKIQRHGTVRVELLIKQAYIYQQLTFYVAFMLLYKGS